VIGEAEQAYLSSGHPTFSNGRVTNHASSTRNAWWFSRARSEAAAGLATVMQ
jgi:hypothetical protein